jgi:hypothetical protein
LPVLVGPRMARTLGSNMRGSMSKKEERDAPWHDASRLSMVAATGRVAGL